MSGLSVIKGLTLTQPWATLVELGLKKVETRSWNTSYRGWLAIHAAKGFPRWAREFADELVDEGIITSCLPLGRIIAVARLDQVVPTDVACRYLDEKELRFGDYDVGRHAWAFGAVKRLATPIECRGALSLWHINPEIHMQILRQVA